MEYGSTSKVANPARGQLNRENEYFPVPVFAPENLVSRDESGRPFPRPPCSFYTPRLNLVLTHGPRFPRRRPSIIIPSTAISSID